MFTPGGIIYICLPKDMSKYVYSHTVYKIQNLETTKITMNSRMDKLLCNIPVF